MSSSNVPLNTPEQYEKLALAQIESYKRLYAQWEAARLKPCDCDRMTCGNCMEVDSIRDHLNRMVIGL